MTYQKRMTFWVALDSIIVLSAIYISYFTLHPSLQLLSSKLLLVTSISLLVSHHVFALFISYMIKLGSTLVSESYLLLSEQ